MCVCPGAAGLQVCPGLPDGSGQQLGLPGGGQQHRHAVSVLPPPRAHEQVQCGGLSSDPLRFCCNQVYCMNAVFVFHFSIHFLQSNSIILYSTL